MSANEEGFEINLPDIFLSHLDTLCTEGSVALGMLESGEGVKNADGNAGKEMLDVTVDMIDASFISYVTSKYAVDDNAVAKHVAEEEEKHRANRRKMCLCLLLLIVVVSIAILIPLFILGDFPAAGAVRSFFGGTGVGTDTTNVTATNNTGAIDTTFNGTLGDIGLSMNDTIDEVSTKEVEKEEEEPEASLSTNDAMDVGVAATNEEEEKETGEEGEKTVRIQWHDDFADVPLVPSGQSVTVTKVQKGTLDVDEPTIPVCGDGIAIISGDLFCYTLDDGRSASRTCKFFKKGNTETRLRNHCNANNLGADFCEICRIHLEVEGN